MVAAEKTVEIVLAALLAFYGLFDKANKAFVAGNYKDASVAYTKIIEGEHEEGRIRTLSRLYRGQCYLKLDKKDLALKDFYDVINEADDIKVRKEAVTFFKKNGGKLEKMLPEKTPGDALDLFIQFCGDGKVAKALESAGGEIKNWLDLCIKTIGEKEIVREVARGVKRGRMKFEKLKDPFIDEEDYKVKSLYAFNVGEEFRFSLFPENGVWKASEVYEFVKRRRNHFVDPQQVVTEQNKKTLRDMGTGFAIAFEANKDEKSLWQAMQNNLKTGRYKKADGKMVPFILVQKVDKLLTCVDSSVIFLAPEAVMGKRLGLFKSGKVEELTEEKLKLLVAEQDLNVPGFVKKENVKADDKERISALIKQLGSASFKERKQAQKELLTIGAEAVPFLQDSAKSRDPEVKSSSLNLLRVLGVK